MENLDWKGNSVSYLKTSGFSNNAKSERQSEDLYCTHP
jgi:hypothetical protein